MSLLNCPPPSSISTIPSTSCPIRFDQIQKMYIRRIGGKVALTQASIKLLATLTPLLTATNNTKLLVTPELSNVVIPSTEILREGGNDNSTLNGVSRVLGLGNAQCSAFLENVSAETASATRKLFTETAIQAGKTNLEAIFVNRDGKLICDTDGVNVSGFPIYNFIVGDVGSEGFNKQNITPVHFELKGGWSESYVMIEPTDYNPLNISN